MAENTRLKDLIAKIDNMQVAMDQREERLMAAIEHRDDRVKLLEISLQSISKFIEAHMVSSNVNSIEASQPSQSLQEVEIIREKSFTTRSVKFDFPRFDGEELLHWVYRAEQFFSFYRIPDDERLEIASMHFDGPVVPWYQMVEKEGRVKTWAALVDALEDAYGPSIFENPEFALFKLTQAEESVASYYANFTTLANRVDGIAPSVMISCFISGLRKEIQRDIIPLKPESLSKAAKLARLYEDKYAPIPKANVKRSQFSPDINVTAVPGKIVNTVPKVIQTSNTPSQITGANYNNNSQPFKRISFNEMQLRKAKGLCFNCDEKFSPTHRCQTKRLLLLQWYEEPPDGEEQEVAEFVVELENSNSTEESVPRESSPKSSLNAMNSAAATGTMRFIGSIKGQPVNILLDGGSDDNFIQPRIAKFLQLDIHPTATFKVLVGDGNSLQVEGKVDPLQIKIQGCKLSFPVYLLPIAGAEVIMGASWLATLGAHIMDYRSLSLQFYCDGKFVTLTGDKRQGPQPTTMHQLHRLSSVKSIAECYQLTMESAESYPTNSLNHRLQEEVKTDNCFNPALKIPDELPDTLKQILLKYQRVFEIPRGLPPSRLCDHRIPLQPDANPIKVRPYRYPHSQKTEIETMVDQMLREGLIEPSNSPFSSPIILVKKKDGTWRFCTDYRALNAITVKDAYPIPVVDELLDELHGAKYFSKLDLRSGYHQVLLHPEDKFKTAFRTHHGHFQWVVMPFGLTNAPATFQSLMNGIFQFAMRKFVLIFFDDILIYSADWESHLQHLEIVLITLNKHQLFAKFSKCEFGMIQIEYLGHTVSAMGVQMEKSKVEAIIQWPTPTNIKQLRGFLGLSGYYRRFIANYASVAHPLTELLKKDAFQWSVIAQEAFQHLKQKITTAPVLKLPDFSKHFVLETDASGLGIGAVLSQDQHPIAFFSKKLTPAMQKQSAYVRELFAVTEAVSKFRHYLVGHKFIIRTDQESLKHLCQQTIQTPEQQRWLPKLLGYDFSIEYKPGRDNIPADALSRCYLMALSSRNCFVTSQLQKLQQQDPYCVNKLTALQQGTNDDTKFTLRQNLLCYDSRIVVPDNSEIKTQLLQEYHATRLGGHAGSLRTYARISSHFYWQGLRRDVVEFVKKCMICQKAKTDNTHPAGLLQPLPIPQKIWEEIAMDFIIGLPNSKGFTVILVVVDRLSKFGHFIPLRNDFSSTTVATAFIQNIIKLHGVPKSIVTDRDRIFLSKFWRSLFQAMGTTLAMSTAYHPQSDGQTEALNKCLEMYLRCFVAENPKTWLDLLPWAQYWYNTSFHCSAGMSPFQIVYGREPPSLITYYSNENDIPDIASLLQQRDKVLQQLKQNLVKAQQHMKKMADKRRKEISFEEGQWVFVKLQPYRQHSLALRKNQKLSMRYFGPFQVLKRIGTVAYQLALPEEARIHSVFHVSLLKKCEGDPGAQANSIPLPLMTNETGPCLQPISILQTRTILKDNQWVKQVLIQWEGSTATDNSWEDVDLIRQYYPSFNLEDKVIVKGGSNVMKEKSLAGKSVAMKDAEVELVGSKMAELADDVATSSLAGQRTKRERRNNVRLSDFVYT